jgi:Gluconate 2-dehydrogenase subunit 3
MSSEKPTENSTEDALHNSTENPLSGIDLRQDRRQWLKRSATMIGASLLPATAIAGETAPQAEAKTSAAAAAPENKTAARFFTPTQHALVEELTETIIPEDSHSGGAKAAKVADTIDQYLRETYDENDRALWREGLRLIDLMSQHYNGKTFVNASPDERLAMLTVLSENSQRMIEVTEVRFFNSLKELTIGCYYTSKIGIHDDLQYKGNRVIQEYVGCDDQGAAKT